MSVVDNIKEGTRLLDRNRGRERVVRSVSRLGRVVKLWFDDPKTGGVEGPIPYPVAEAEQRFEIITGGSGEFRAESEIVRLVAECHRLAHAYLFNPVFATETSLIDALPHQLIAVYDHLLHQPRLRFLLADDAGAGKTIMAGLLIREMLLRRLVSRVLIVPPAGLVGNWERELRNLFRLRFRILSSSDGVRENPFDDPRNDLAIISIDTVDRTRMLTYIREARPYDLVVFDEAHKLSATRGADLTIDASRRYELAAEIASQMRHLLLLTATPHMGKEEPYFFLWRLLEPELLSTPEAFGRLTKEQRARYFLRRMKEEMVRFDETPLYPPRTSKTVAYPLTPDERTLYDGVTNYCEVRLGTQPNLTHMHVRAIEAISSKPEKIDDELRARIRAAKLAEVEEGVVPHNLPDGPKDVGDTAELHFVVLPPECVVDLGKPVPSLVEAYFNQTSGPKNPRTYRNAVVAVAPDRAKLAGVRERVVRLLGWQAVEKGEERKMLSDGQQKELVRRRKEADDGLPGAVRAAYSVLVAVGEGGAVESGPLPAGEGTAFERAKAELVRNERMLATSLDPELFLPESHLDLWAAGEMAKKAKDLVAAFAQFPRLPRLLRPRVLQDSLARGVRDGKIVLQINRGDGSVRTVWRVEPSTEDLARPDVQVVPLAFALLHEIEPDQLLPDRVEGLWESAAAPLSTERIESFFDGTHAPRPAGPAVIDKAVRAAVQRGLLMARSDGKTFLRQNLPDGAIPPDLELLLPPPPVRAGELSAREVPEAWKDGTAALTAIARSVSQRRGYTVPWVLLRDGVTEGLSARHFEVVETGVWPCGPTEMERVTLRVVEVVELDAAELVSAATQTVWATASPTLGKLKSALETAKGRSLPDDVYRKAVESALARGLFALNDPKKSLPTGKAFADVRVRVPKASLFAEAQLNAQEIQDFAEVVSDLKRGAPELDFSFRVTVTAEGDKPSAETLAKLNEVLAKVTSKWRLE